jgi:hypothetical protein
VGVDAVEELRTSEPLPFFTELSRNERRSVRSLAKKGELHPDPAIAVSSLVYALRSRTRWGRAGTWISLAAGVLAIVPGIGPDGGEAALHTFVNRRMINDLTALADRNDWRLAGYGVAKRNRANHPVTDLAMRYGVLLSADSPIRPKHGRHGRRRAR